MQALIIINLSLLRRSFLNKPFLYIDCFRCLDLIQVPLSPLVFMIPTNGLFCGLVSLRGIKNKVTYLAMT